MSTHAVGNSDPRSQSFVRIVCQHACEGRRSYLAPCLIALGFAPLVFLHARGLWDRPHLQAYPFAVAGGLYLCRMATRGLGQLNRGARPLSLAAMLACAVLLMLAALSAWTWLGMLAAMAALLAAAYCAGGSRLVRAVLPAWIFVALAVLPPNNWETILVGYLQRLVSECTDILLDMLSVLHVTEGSVITFPGRSLFIEQACSGIRSLLFVMGITLFYVLRKAQTPLRAACLLGAALFWVLLGNIARVTSVAYFISRWRIDLSTGTRHEIVGLVVLAVVLAFVASSDYLFRFLAALWKVRWFRPLAWTGPVGTRVEAAPGPAAAPTALPDLRQTWLGSWLVAGAFAAFGVIQLPWLAPVLAAAVGPDRLVARLHALQKSDLPDRFGNVRCDGFEVQERDTGSDFGNFTRAWRYRDGNATATVSADYPFRGWHELTRCYVAVGWTLDTREIHRTPAGSFIQATLHRPGGQFATLLFGLDDVNGASLEPRSFGSPLEYLRNRFALLESPPDQLFARVASRYEAMPHAYQIQLLIESAAPLSENEQTAARSFYEKSRRALSARIAGLGSHSMGEGS